MRRLLCSVLLFGALSPAVLSAPGQTPIPEAITTKFALTKASADRKDVVTAGAVLVLKKDGLVMFATDAKVKASTSYKEGKLQPSAQTKMATMSIFGHDSGIAKRTFVAGEKFWLIDVQSQSDGVQLQLLSDPYSDVRYMTFLKFPYPKGGTPSSEQILGEIAQVMSVDSDAPTQQTAGGSAPASSQAPPSSAAAPPAAQQTFAPIAPPPPPADQPAVEIGVGSTREQVIAAWGQPQSTAKISATKDIAVYTTQKMKVTYTNNKVTNLQ